jgi:outer membrane protein TolC
MMLSHALLLVLAAKAVTLEEVKAAARHNLDSIRSEVAFAQSQANKTVAISGMLPHASLNASASYTASATYRRVFSVETVNDAGVGTGQFSQQAVDYTPSNILSLSAGVSVSQLIYDAHFWAQLAQAGAQEDASKGELEEQRLASEFEAVRRFYEALYAQRGRKILEDAVERSKGQLARAQGVFAAGKGHQHDILDARVNLGNDAISLLRWDQLIVSNHADLTQWLGWPYEPLEALMPGILQLHPPKPAPKIEDVLALANVHRPIIKAVADRVRAAQAGINLVTSEYIPSVSVGGSYSREAPTAGVFVDPNRQHVFAVGASLNWNFFSGLSTLGRGRSAAQDLVLAEATQSQTLSNLGADIAREYEVLKTDLEIADMAEKNKDFAEEETKLAEQRYAVGVGTNLDVRNAQLKLTQSQQQALMARFDVEISRARLSRLAGVSIE